MSNQKTIHTHLTQLKVDSMDNAVEVFSKVGQDGRLPLVLVPTRSICSMWMWIPDGVHVVMQKWGKSIESMAPGLQFPLGPWYKVAFLVSKQSCAYNAPVKNCPTKDNVMVEVDLTIVFRVTNPSDFVYKLGALKFDQLLQAATDESIRGLVRATSHDKVYELRGSRASKFLGNLNQKFDMFGVSFSDATITNVLLPDDLATTLEKETAFDSKQKEEEEFHQYELKILRDKADLLMKQLKAKNERLLEDENAKKERALIRKGQEEVEAQRKKQVEIIKSEELASVMKYEAKSKLINSKIQGEKESSLLILRAEGESQALKIKVDQECKTLEIKSNAEVVASENLAKAIKVEADAEEKASEKLKERRAYELKLKRLEVLEKLAKNGKIVISGKNGDSIIQSLVDVTK